MGLTAGLRNDVMSHYAVGAWERGVHARADQVHGQVHGVRCMLKEERVYICVSCAWLK